MKKIFCTLLILSAVFGQMVLAQKSIFKYGDVWYEGEESTNTATVLPSQDASTPYAGEITIATDFIYTGDRGSILFRVDSIADGAFKGCEITKVTMEEGIQIIGAEAFSGTGLEEIKFPDSVEKVGDQVLYNCWSLETITFGKNLTKIGKEFVDSWYRGSVYMMCDQMPEINTTNFYYMNVIKLWTPREMMPQYMTTAPWEDAREINGIAKNWDLHDDYVFGTTEDWTFNDEYVYLADCKILVEGELYYIFGFKNRNWRSCFIPVDVDLENLIDQGMEICEVAAARKDDEGNSVIKFRELTAWDSIYNNRHYIIRNTAPELTDISTNLGQGKYVHGYNYQVAEKGYMLENGAAGLSFIGTFVPESAYGRNKYVLSGNRICMAANENVMMKPNRWYMTATGVMASEIRVELETNEGIQTGLDNLSDRKQSNLLELGDGKVYDLSARQMLKTQKGISIRNGKIVFVKD